MKSHGWAVMFQHSKDGPMLLDCNIFPTKEKAEVMAKLFRRTPPPKLVVVKCVKLV